MTAPLTVEQIEAIEALEKAATPGPWSERTTGGSLEQVSAYICNYDGDRYLGTVADVYGTGNAALIAAMRNALPQLLAMARKAAQKIEWAQSYGDLQDDCDRYLAALQAEAIRVSRKKDGGYWPNIKLGDVRFTVTRNEATGELQAEEVQE